MKIALISPYPDITAFGVRTLAAHLKANGHNVRMIFMPDPFGDNIIHGVDRYTPESAAAAAGLCRDCDVAGISLMTNFFACATQLTDAIRSVAGIPVIWGGVHPTIRPGECIGHADMVCIGEGDDSLLELLDRMRDGKAYYDVPNFWFRTPDGVRKNPLTPLPANLDAYPPPDYSMDDHWVLVDGEIIPLTHGIMEKFLRRGTVAAYLGKTGYQTMTSRGCPFSCSYCINDTIKKMYGGRGRLRWRSIGHVMDEIRAVKRDMPYVDYIWISDDEFTSRKEQEIAEFCEVYKRVIQLPFSCLVSPVSITEGKMRMLVDAGLIYVQMGVESGSERMLAVFRRSHMNNEKMERAIAIINKFKDSMYPPSYDFLLDVPGETDADRIANLRFISRIPKPFRIQPFTLVPYPGTEMYDIAKGMGYIPDDHRDIYNKTYTMRRADYLNMLMLLVKTGRFPAGLLRVMISRPVAAVMNSRPVNALIAAAYPALRALKHRLRGVSG